MFVKKKKIALMTMMIFLVIGGQVFAQTAVLGFKLGKSTFEEVKAKLPKGVEVLHERITPGDYGGPAIMTNGKNYGIDGLLRVSFCFDQKNNLTKILMSLENRRFNDVKKVLFSKYRLLHSEAPFLFKANNDYVYLYLPRDVVKGMPSTYSFGVEYMTGNVYQKEQLEVRESEKRRKAEERRIKKALEQEAAAEAAKF